MADKKKKTISRPKRAVESFTDKILQNATAIDAAVVIVQQKLLKLLECKLIITCTILKQQIQDIREHLDPVYEFLTRHPEPEGSDQRSEWNSRLLEAIYQLEDGIDSFRSRIALQDPTDVNQTIGIGCPNMFRMLQAKYSLCRCLQKFKSQITILRDVEKITKQSSKIPSSTKEETFRMQDATEWDKLFSHDVLVNRETADKAMEELMKPLMETKEEHTRIIAIVGKQGIGKTYLARRIFTQLHDHFHCCAWVDVASTNTPNRVIHNLLQQVSNQVPNMSSLMPDVEQGPMRLIEMLWKALYGKRYLIVLDDVGDYSLISDVVGSLVELNCRGGIIITTQDEDMARWIDPDAIELIGLKDDKIQGLVEGKLAIAGKALTWEKVKEAFIAKCRRSPLRLNLLSGLIAESPDPLEVVIDEIPHVDHLDRLSAHCYNKMPQALKPCILYMVLFPKGYLIPVRRLLRLWLSEGFLVVQQEAKGEPEDLGQNFLKELVIRNFIEVVEWKEDGSPRRVRVVSCLYDFLCSIAIGTELLYIINTHKETEDEILQLQQEQSSTTRLRWLVEHSNLEEMTFLSSVAKINHLRSFLSFNPREGTLTQDIGYFLKMVSGKGSNFLTVLDLEDVYKPNLDKVLEKLVILKHLGLRSTALGSIPKSIADLPYLETLDLKYTNITELPKSFWKRSRNLRHLYLNGYCHVNKSNLPSSFETSIKPMANLHTLSGVVVDSFHVDQSTGTIEVFGNMKKLTKLGITFIYHHENQKAIGDWISDLKNLQSLKLGIINSGKPAELPSAFSLSQHHSLSKLYLLGTFEETWKIRLPNNLITLTLSGSQITNDRIFQIGNLTRLKVLNLRANSFTDDRFKLPDGFIPSLEVLRLWKSEKLKKIELCDKLPNIKTIEVRSCRDMEEIKGTLHVAPGDFVSIGKETIGKPKEDKPSKEDKPKEVVSIGKKRITQDPKTGDFSLNGDKIRTGPGPNQLQLPAELLIIKAKTEEGITIKMEKVNKIKDPAKTTEGITINMGQFEIHLLKPADEAKSRDIPIG